MNESCLNISIISLIFGKEPHHWYSIKAKLPPTFRLAIELLVEDEADLDSVIETLNGSLTVGALNGENLKNQETTARERTWAKLLILQALRQLRQLVIQESLST